MAVCVFAFTPQGKTKHLHAARLSDLAAKGKALQSAFYSICATVLVKFAVCAFVSTG